MNLKTIYVKLLTIIYTFFSCFSTFALEVVLLSPAKVDNQFWVQVNLIAHAAANDLGINLTIVHGNGHRLYQKEQLNKIITSLKRPDYIIFLPYDGTAHHSFNLLEQAKVPFLTLEKTLFRKQQKQLGKPGQRFKYWLGEVFHDNKKAGELLAQTLIKASGARNARKSKLNVVGISGDISGHSNRRNAGLMAALATNPHHSLAQIVSARWQRDITSQMIVSLLSRYPEIDIVWTSADIMALGVLDVIDKLDRKINENLFIGGFDWSNEALIAIKNDQYTASVGGHFMQAAWALVKLFDHHQGYAKLPSNEGSIAYQLQLIDKDNINDHLVLIENPNWDKIDFEEFSVSNNSSSKNEQFDFSKVIKALTSQ